MAMTGAEKALRWRQKHPEAAKASYKRVNDNKLANKHGLTLAAVQDRPLHCDLCGGVNKDGRRMFCDHDHRTGQFRAWLCNDCNIGLGKFKDNPVVLQRAIALLRGEL